MPYTRPSLPAPARAVASLTGVTILLVEDSRFCSEAVRLMALRSGARLRRADSIAAAHRHLRMYQPDVVIVDLGLPDGTGLDLIAALGGGDDQRPVVVATSGDTSGAAEAAALKAGASCFLAKPVESLGTFREMIEGLLGLRGPKSPAAVDTEEPELDQQALADDLDRISGILEAALPSGDDAQKRYCAQFISSVALSAHDQKLADAAANFFRRMDQGRAGKRSGQAVLDALRDRLAKRTAIVSANRV